MTVIETGPLPTIGTVPTLDDGSSNPEDVKHLVDQWAEGNVTVAEAYVTGQELTALCGHKFVPHRTPDAFPQCKPCATVLAGLD